MNFLRAWVKRLMPLLGIALFCVALHFLWRQLYGFQARDLMRLGRIPLGAWASAAAITLLNYWVLSGYEWLALKHLGRSLPYRRLLSTSLIASAFSNNLGAAALSGSAARYRLYSAWGFSTRETAQIVGFYSFTFVLGVAQLVGVTLILNPHLDGFIWGARSLQAAGYALLAGIGIYLAVLTAAHRRSWKFRGWTFRLPSPGVGFLQLFLTALDWFSAAAALYVLILPFGPVSFYHFFIVYVLGHGVGMISQVPGGAGVFEAMMVKTLRARVPAPMLVMALLAYRLLYYLIPLMLATLMLGLREVHLGQKQLRRWFKTTGILIAKFTPHVAALSTFTAGIILLVSGATPADGTRLAWLKDVLPLPVMEVSHLMGSLAGVALLFLARSIQRRVDMAYFWTIFLLGLGILFSLLKGWDYEEAMILGIMLLCFLPSRRFFYRKSALLIDRFSPLWVISILTVLGVVIWFGFLSYRHIEYSHELWWRFRLHGDAPRFLRGMVGMLSMALILSLTHLTRIARFEQSLPDLTQLALAWPLARASRDTVANLAMMGDKQLLFHPSGRGFIMFSIYGRSWVALGDPVGDEKVWPELILKFRSLVDQHEGICSFYQVGSEHLPRYLDAGLSLVKVGEEARVALNAFTLEGGHYKTLRQTEHRLTREGCVFKLGRGAELDERWESFRDISDAWLMLKETREKGFSLGFYEEKYLRQFPMAWIEKGGEVLAFSNLFESTAKEELSVDLMRYDPAHAPSGIMDYLFIRLMLWGKEQGYQAFNLGMAPLSGLESHAFAPFWNKIGSLIFSHGERFYHFEGLRQYKEKFGPLWRPRYLAVQGGFSVPKVLTDIAALNSGGISGVFAR